MGQSLHVCAPALALVTLKKYNAGPATAMFPGKIRYLGPGPCQVKKGQTGDEDGKNAKLKKFAYVYVFIYIEDTFPYRSMSSYN